MAVSILFTGHMIDKPGRPNARFPSELEVAAAARIATAIAPYATTDKGSVMGFASCARGGDILFHEQCRAVRIPTTIVLPYSPELFVLTSVKGIPGSDWEQRFWHLWTTTSEAQRETLNLPRSDEAYSICNVHLLERAQEHGAVHLIALWDGQRGDGPGGTADLVDRIGISNKPDIFTPAGLEADE
ncbi:C40 family peptidase [Sinorhizobium prairiense]|uniref:hypothetical protein n=1 Tax=unclassified Sinorhizobium TaxID=2613772 RepID=UPI0023D8B277|nr:MULTISPECIES: hypothetical protein [unclassified Sinorhizobium]WEJ11751.1 hypothetical protein N0Q90_21730 [Sinorhizobium sp. M103]WEJ17613.1 hypothetical protein N0Q91_20610 [Sinorhizobium sp. K101]WEJ40434.1 hypothetical protein N0R80_27500 [Sinorhizobium sp. C101]